MKLKISCCLLLLLAGFAAAQDFNSIQLEHTAYDIIEIGVIRGIIHPLPSVKPWPRHIVVQRLHEMMNDSMRRLSAGEIEIISAILDSFEHNSGLDLRNGRYKAEGTKANNFIFETGINWNYGFSSDILGLCNYKKEQEYSNAAVASYNMAGFYAGGNLSSFCSWNFSAQGGLLFIGINENGVYHSFPYAFGKQWDSGVLSLQYSRDYSAWPSSPSLAYGLDGEITIIADRFLFRAGRLRHEWGMQSSGSSLFINAQGRPFAAIESVASPLPWLNLNVLFGALEYYREKEQWPAPGPFSNYLSAVQAEINPLDFLYFCLGGTVLMKNTINSAFFSGLELRLPGLAKIWGSLFVNSLDFASESFYVMNTNQYAFQAGLKATVRWLPFASFSFRYTKIEPYCYTGDSDVYNGEQIPSSAFMSGGESLGYYLPPNSDEFLLRLESGFAAGAKTWLQYQMIRHGADYGYGAVPGSSLRDKLTAPDSFKYFLTDGVYRWDHLIKLGASLSLRNGIIPLAIFAEAGLAARRFTINGTAGIGNEAEYESLDDPVYRAANGLIFSIGFKLFSVD